MNRPHDAVRICHLTGDYQSPLRRCLFIPIQNMNASMKQCSESEFNPANCHPSLREGSLSSMLLKAPSSHAPQDDGVRGLLVSYTLAFIGALMI